MFLFAALPLLAASSLVTGDDATVGRIAYNVSPAPFAITSGKRLRTQIAELLHQQADNPIIFQSLSLPHIDGLTVDDVPSSMGSLFSLKESVSKSMSGFVTYSIFDSLSEVVSEEVSDFDQGSVLSTSLPAISVITDVPNLINAGSQLELQILQPTELQTQLLEIQKRLLSSIGDLDAVDIAQLPEELKGSMCGHVVQAEFEARRAVDKTLETLPATGHGKPVVIMVLTQGITCFAEEGNKQAILKAIDLLYSPVANIRIVVPVQTWAPLDVAVAIAKSLTHTEQITNRRRLQAVDDDYSPDVLPVNVHEALDDVDDIAPDLNGPGGRGMSKSLLQAPSPTYRSYLYTERRLIFTSVSIVLAAGALLAVVATANMQLNKDPLLYTKINTGGH